MSFNTTNLPQPQALEKVVGVSLEYDSAATRVECLGISLVRIVEPPEYPDTECLVARMVHEEAGPSTYQTSILVLPLEYVTGLDLVTLPTDLEFLPPFKELFIRPDKPATQNRLPVPAIKHRLAEFNVII